MKKALLLFLTFIVTYSSFADGGWYNDKIRTKTNSAWVSSVTPPIVYAGDWLEGEIWLWYQNDPGLGAQFVYTTNNWTTTQYDLFSRGTVSGNDARYANEGSAIGPWAAGTVVKYKIQCWHAWKDPDFYTNEASFAVNALNNPSAQSATSTSASSVDLSWAKDAQNHYVMIVRKKSTDSWTEPTQGTLYSIGNMIGSGEVVYFSNGTSYSNNGLLSSTGYDYKFYTENNGYYSAGITASTTTQSASTDYFKSKTDGLWNSTGTWQSSVDNVNWVDATLTPASSGNTIINNVVSINAAESTTNLTINAEKTLTINSGKSLTVTGTLTNNGGISGLVIESGAMLNHSTDNVVAKLKREIAKDSKWHFISSPNTDQMPEICNADFAPVTTNFNPTTGATFDFYKYSEGVASGGNVWNNIKKADFSLNTTDFGTIPLFESGKGYLVWYSTSFEGSSTKSFGGKLANGNLSIPVTVAANKFNLIGNPFCSAIDWKAATGWTRTVLKASGGGYNLWAWNGTNGNYGVYNSAETDDEGTNGVGRYIGPTQGFFVQAESAGNINLTNQVRVLNTGTQIKSGSVSEGSVRLKVASNNTSFSDEIKISFGSKENDGGAAKWWSMYPEAPSLYIVKNNKNFSLNFLTSITENPVVPVSFKAGTDGDYVLNSSFDSNEFGSIVLQDMKTGMEQNLKSNPVYAFSASTSDDPGRFILKFGGVGISNPESYQSGIYTYNNKLYIDNPGNAILEIYNMAGQKQFSRQINDSGLFQTSLPASIGYYVVRLTAAGQVRIAKVFIK